MDRGNSITQILMLWAKELKNSLTLNMPCDFWQRPNSLSMNMSIKHLFYKERKATTILESRKDVNLKVSQIFFVYLSSI